MKNLQPISRNSFTTKFVAIELACIALVFFVSLGAYFAVSGTKDDPLEHPLYLQTNMLYPAVFFAASHGMGTTDIHTIPGLDEFIYKQASTFDTASIPEDITVVPLKTVWELTHIYYIYAVGWLWRIFGVSAWVVVLYAALLRALSAVAMYGIFRFTLGRAGSVSGALLICTSPVMWNSAVDLRDFGKAPFILGSLFGILCLIRFRLSPWKLFGFAGYLGLLLGLGLGFRQDLLVCMPPAVVTLLFFSRTTTRHLGMVRLAAVGVLLAVFIATGLPVMRGIALEGGQATLHAFFHGISPDTEGRLKFGGAAYDSLISVDPAAYGIVNVYARRRGNQDSMVNTGSSEYLREQGDVNAPLLWDPFIYFTGAKYARFANAVIKEHLWLFSADFVSRSWRAVFALPGMPAQMHDDMRHSIDHPPAWLHGLLLLQGVFAKCIARFGLLCILVALVAFSARHVVLALYMTILLAYFAGYPTLWYEYRHFFFLAFIPVWALLMCVEWPIWYLWSLRSPAQRQAFKQQYLHDRGWRRPARNVLAYVLVMLLIILLPVLALRWWQIQQVHTFARQLSATRLESFPVNREPKEGRLHFSPATALPGLENAETLPPGETAWEYLAVVFETRGEDIPFTIHYDDSRIMYAFTQTIRILGIPDDDGRVTLFFPVYEVDMNYGGDLMAKEILKTYPKTADIINDPRPVSEQEWWRRGRFLGISFPEEFEDDFVGFYRVENLQGLRLLPIFQLPEELRLLRPYKTGPWERVLRRLPPWQPVK